jgi:hypothetical protein
MRYGDILFGRNEGREWFLALLSESGRLFQEKAANHRNIGCQVPGLPGLRVIIIVCESSLPDL